MKKQLFAQAIVKFLSGLLLTAALLFLPAGTLDYWNGWLFLGVLFVPMFAAGIVLLFRSPALLQKRLNVRESEAAQKQVIAWSGVMFLAAFLLAGFNVRFGWFRTPRRSVWTATGVFLLGYLLYAEVLRENAYLSRTIEVQAGQTVIDTGLYGVVRHPMYAATLLLFLSMPWILGSPLSFAVLLCYLPIIGKRIRNEEDILVRELAGYAAYRERVRYKVIPLIW